MPVHDGTTATSCTKPDHLFQWDHEAPSAFVERLDDLWPPYGRTPWLVPVWSAGEPDEPVQRWVIYVARPACTLTEDEQEEIRARSLEVLPPGVRSESPLAVLRAMELAIEPVPYAEASRGRLRTLGYWEAHRALLLPVWVVQGENGGHPYRWTEHEKRMLRLEKLPDDEPAPGSLPFHPLDERVIGRLVRFDRMRRLQKFGGVNAKQMEKEEQERIWRRSFLDFMDVNDHETREMADLLSRCGVASKSDRGMGADETEARYVETGIL